MRVYELARQLDISNKELLDHFEDLGVEVKSHSSSVDDKAIRLLLDKIQAEQKRSAPGKAGKPRKPPRPQPVVAEQPKEEDPPGPKVNARAIALEAIARAKAKREKQRQEAMEQGQPAAMKAPEHQKVALGEAAVSEKPPIAPPPPAAAPA
ncbi:translation initiation factor IF-2 N-terminal domain-containing protein, partial [bacterium]|nr:translation initiation factor IF-2 N-terminal domain-containing protein [bacterium]